MHRLPIKMELTTFHATRIGVLTLLLSPVCAAITFPQGFALYDILPGSRQKSPLTYV